MTLLACAFMIVVANCSPTKISIASFEHTDSHSIASEQPIVADCSNCPSVGNSSSHMLCAIDLCEESSVVSATFESPTFVPGNSNSCNIDDSYEAVSHFGDLNNDLEPILNNSYALMSTGDLSTESHVDLCHSSLQEVYDPFPKSGEVPAIINDTLEWKLVLRAPVDANAFQFKYIFFSSEYDESIDVIFNDKFYAILESQNTNNGLKTVINFTDCRNQNNYYDFICESSDRDCEEGQKYCYIAVNNAFSECCWYNGCPDSQNGNVTTNIMGTGFECAQSQFEDFDKNGSSTGWLKTTWPITAGEQFTITFHIHDSQDSKNDSEIIIDSFQFIKGYDFGTVKIE